MELLVDYLIDIYDRLKPNGNFTCYLTVITLLIIIVINWYYNVSSYFTARVSRVVLPGKWVTLSW